MRKASNTEVVWKSFFFLVKSRNSNKSFPTNFPQPTSLVQFQNPMQTSPQNSITTFANFNKHPCEYNRSHYGAQSKLACSKNFPRAGKHLQCTGGKSKVKPSELFPCCPKFRRNTNTHTNTWSRFCLSFFREKSFASPKNHFLCKHFGYLRTTTGKVLENRISHWGSKTFFASIMAGKVPAFRRTPPGPLTHKNANTLRVPSRVSITNLIRFGAR